MPDSLPSMQVIAERAGVSRMTVSLALRNHPRISAPVRERIHTIARELGYALDPITAAHMHRVRARKPVKHAGTIAFVTAHPTRDGWRHRGRIHLDYFDGAVERSRQLGYRLEEIWAREPGMTNRRLSQILLARGIRGLLLAPLLTARGHLSLNWPQFAVATVGYSVWKPSFHRAVTNHFQLTQLAIRRLTHLGYRRIGLVIEWQLNERTNHQYTAAMMDHHRTMPRANRIAPLLPREFTETIFRKWFKEQQPDSIISPNMAILKCLRAQRVKIPEQLGFVHPGRGEVTLPVAGIEQHGRIIGAAAIDLIAEQLHRNEFGVPAHPKVVLINGTWGDGPTVRT